MNTYYVQDANGEFPGKLVFQQNPPIDPPPVGYIATTVVPDDERMYWNMVDAWYWPKVALKQVAIDHLNISLNNPFNFNGNQLSVFNLPFYLSMAHSASMEEPDAERFCRFDGTTIFPTLTNSELVEAVLALSNKRQDDVDAYSQMLDLIDNETVVDLTGLESQWVTLTSSATPRPRLPNLSDLSPYTDSTTPIEAGTVVLRNGKRSGLTRCTHSSSLNDVTFELPDDPRTGQEVTIFSNSEIVNISFSNGEVLNPPNQAQPNDCFRIVCLTKADLEAIPVVPAQWGRVL
jgi:hypothetical protein